MQKKLIALAVASLAAGSAFAQSNVTVSGMVSVSNNYWNFSDKAAGSLKTNENRLDDNTSRFTVKGTEDLGGGLSAYFQIENRVSADTRPNSTFGNAQGLADGESFVGLKHNNLGSVGFGKFAMHYHEAIGYSESYRAIQTQMYGSTGILGQISGTYIAGSTRAQNTIKYDTPNFSGFSGKLAYSFSPFGNEGTITNTGATGGVSNQYGGAPAAAVNGDYNDGYAWTIAGRYNNGPINALLSYYKFSPEYGTSTNFGKVGGQESWKAHFDYKFGFGLKVGVGYDRSKAVAYVSGLNSTNNLVTNDRTRSAWMIPVSYNFGAHGVYFTYAKANSFSGVSNSGADQYTLAYDYALSKRTYVGASYVALSNSKNAAYQPWLSGISTLGGSGLVAGENASAFSLNMTDRKSVV